MFLINFYTFLHLFKHFYTFLAQPPLVFVFVVPPKTDWTPKLLCYRLSFMLLSEDILIVQAIFVCREQWHDYTNYMNCSNFKEALPKTQKYSLTASFEFFKSFNLEWSPELANRLAIKTSFSSCMGMYIWYQALCNIKYIGYLNSPNGEP